MRRKDADRLLIEAEESALFMDGYDDAIIGVGCQVGKPPRVVYSREKCIRVLMDRDGMTHAEAEEWFSYNSERACGYKFDDSPILVTTEVLDAGGTEDVCDDVPDESDARDDSVRA
jgi:hypothetical protein